MSILSPIDTDLALVYSPLMPVPFRETLLSRGTQLVEVPDSEFETMGCNVLAVAPRKCVMLTGNPQTRLRLERAGVEVYEFDGQEIWMAGKATRRRKLGAIIGDRVETGINASINIGSMIGNDTQIGPGAVVSGIISPGSKIF